MRAAAVAVALVAFGSTSSIPQVAYLRGSTLYLGDRVSASHVSGAVRWSGDGKLVSVGGEIIGGPTLGTGFDLTWAQSGEAAAFLTAKGGAAIWTPSAGSRRILPDGWGATGFAWRADGALAIGRAICNGSCGVPSRSEVWLWKAWTLNRILGPKVVDRARPIPVGWHAGRLLWWSYPNSASIAADGVALMSGDKRIADTLMYPDYVAVCGRHLALAAGGDRYAMHGKRILFDGHDVSRDRSRSWVSPSCTADGALVAAASKNTVPPLIGREHRAIWRLLPARKQLTHPPKGRTDEDPHLLPDGSVLFLRTRSVARPRQLYGVGTIELLRNGKLTALGTAGKADNYYGHYAWADLVAVAP
jgi:hypothetical protein